MELKEFISKALLDIVGGVIDAQEKLPSNIIVPKVVDNFKAVDSGISDLQVVDFEVSVIADKKTGGEAKISVVAAIIGGKVSGELNRSISNASKISFKVPIRFPRDKSD